MIWLKFLLRDFFANSGDILLVLLTLGVISVIGLVFFRSLIKESRVFVLIPAGMVTGTAVFIFYLGVFSHLLKGRSGILNIFIIYSLSGLLLLLRNRTKWKMKFPKLSFNFWLYVVLASALVFIIFVKSGNAVFGGDAITYWGLGTSFANGNYPQILPWQPQFLTVHHQGAFLFEGAIHAITGVDIRQVHFLFAPFIIVGGFFLLWGFLNDKPKKAIISAIPSLLGYIVFGGIFIILPLTLGWLEPQKTLVNVPILHDAKNALGALTSFFDLYYLIPRTVALALIILSFVIITGKIAGSERKRLILLSALLSVILSVDESMFAAIILPVSLWVVFQFLKSKEKKVFLKNALISLLVFFTLFWVIGNPVRDSLLTPSPAAPRFSLVELSESMKQGRIGFLKSVTIFSKRTPALVWYLPNFKILLGVTLLLAFIWGGPLAILFAFAAVGTTALYFLVEHTFWPSNYPRFLLSGYQFIGFAMGIIIYKLFTFDNSIFKRLLGVFFILLITPSLLANGEVIIRSLPSKQYSNFAPITTEYPVLTWTKKNLSFEDQVFFVDGFLYGKPHSDYVLHGTQGFGLSIPISSAQYKMHTAEFGFESLDLINTLSPSAIRLLGIDYIYITFDQIPRLSQERRRDVSNTKYFQPVYEDNLGKMYKIKEAYLTNGIEEAGMIRELPNLIPDGSDIYVGKQPDLNYYIRAAILLAIKDRGNIYSVWGSGHYNYVETFIEIKGPELSTGYDYLILAPESNPRTLCDCGTKVIWKGNGAILYEIVQK